MQIYNYLPKSCSLPVFRFGDCSNHLGQRQAQAAAPECWKLTNLLNVKETEPPLSGSSGCGCWNQHWLKVSPAYLIKRHFQHTNNYNCGNERRPTILAETRPRRSPSSAVVLGQNTPTVVNRRFSARTFRLSIKVTILQTKTDLSSWYHIAQLKNSMQCPKKTYLVARWNSSLYISLMMEFLRSTSPNCLELTGKQCCLKKLS